MFKTVRKGDASLQYTILPQIDQFSNNGPPPQPPDTRQPSFHKLIIPFIFIGICFCSILTISALLIMTRHESDSYNVTELKQVKSNDVAKINDNQTATTASSMYVKETKVITENVAAEINSIIETTADSVMPEILQKSPNSDNNVPEIMDTVTDITSPENKLILTEVGIGSPPPEEMNFSQSSGIPITILPSTTIDTSLYSTSSNSQTTILNDSMTNSMSSKTNFKRAKIDTISQMYMKAGITSYNKGNITTSVLTHGLSLEGLIFKTPEGTNKPWSKKCVFSDSTFYARLKRYCEAGGRFFAFGLSLGAIASMICSIIVLAKFKKSPMRWANTEETPLSSKDDEEQDDTSKLLQPEAKLINEKE